MDVVPQMPLLWVLRDSLGMTGTKFGCGMALCGACTVHINGQPTRSCITQVSTVAGKTVTTIEGLSSDNSHPVQKAWIEADVPQCGYCQSGQIMTAAALVAKTTNPYGFRYRRSHARQPVPLRDLPGDPPGGASRCAISGAGQGRCAMTNY